MMTTMLVSLFIVGKLSGSGKQERPRLSPNAPSYSIKSSARAGFDVGVKEWIDEEKCMVSRYKKQDSGPTTLQKKKFLAQISFDFSLLIFFLQFFFIHSPFIPQLAPLGFASLLLTSSFILREFKRNVVNPESCFLYLLQYPIKILFKNSLL